MFRFFLTLLIILVVCTHCKKEDTVPGTGEISGQLEERLDLNDAIIKSPPSLVSVTAVLELEFRNPVVPEHLSGTTLDKNPLRFNPEIAGQAQWVTRSLLRFIPDGHLPAGTTVEATLVGKTAFGEQKDVNDFRFRFKVAEQEVISLIGDFLPVEDKKNTVIYSGIMTFAQPTDRGQLLKDIAFRGPEGQLNLRLETVDKPNMISVVSAPLIRTDKGKSYTLTLPGKYTADNKKWEKSVYLPGIDIFRVLSHMDATEPESEKPVYALRFSDPVRKDTDLSGYITLDPEIPFDLRVSGKYLYIQGDFLPGKSYTLTIRQGFPSVFGTKLSDTYSTELLFNNIKPEIAWLSEGVYLPASNTYKLQFKSVNVAKVRVSVTEIFPQNVGFFIQRNAIMDRNETSGSRYGYYYSSQEYEDLSRVGEEIFQETLEITNQRNTWIKTELDLAAVFKGRHNSVFVVRLEFTGADLTGRCTNDLNDVQPGDLYFEDDDYYSNPCRNGYYYSRGSKSKLLIASNVGLTLKRSDQGIHVFATDVLTTRPIPNLNLKLYNYQNRIISSRSTDAKGYTLFPEDGYYLYGESEYGIALIRVDHNPWELNQFDVGGGSGGQKGTDVFMYTDRGVHRPGDTVYYAAIIRVNREAPPEKQPVTLQVKNPKGQVVVNKKTACGFNGHIHFPVVTDLSDPTGNWTARLEVGDQVFTKILKIETVKPDRLKTDIDIPETLDFSGTVLTGQVRSNYLFGAPASGLKTTINLEVFGKEFSHGKWDTYVFASPLARYGDRNYTVYDGFLDEQGRYAINFPLPDFSKVPALIQGLLRVTVYEKGGNFTERTRPLTIYPYESFTGIKDIFEGRWAKLGEHYSLPVIVVNRDGAPLAGHSLKISIYVNRNHWWWDYDQWDRRDFRRMETTYLVATSTIKSETEPVNHTFVPEDNGRHYIEVKDLTSGHETGLFIDVSRWGGAVSAEGKERNYLQIGSDKNIYQPGDMVTLSFESPSEGAAYLTLEQGKKIVYRDWKTVQSGQTTFRFPVTEEMVPNCYASVSVIQPHSQTVNDLPMRIYGVKPLYVENRASRLALTLSAPDELKPRQTFDIAVTSRAPRTATFTLAVVDEGLLDLTAFETPSPWDYFFQKIGLGVITTDNFDQILGVLYPDIDKYFSIGGGVFDEEREKRLGDTRVRRFEPVVMFKEPTVIDPGKTVKTSFTMPNYVGSVRIMLVGAAGHSYMSVEKAVPVKQSLMILPTIPRVARPGDTFDLPVSVFATDSLIKTATVSVRTSSNLYLPDAASRKVSFPKPGEQDTRFRVGIGRRIGADTITVMAESKNITADQTVFLPITSANPFYTEVLDTTVTRNKPLVLKPQKFGLEGTNKARLAVSRLPDIQLDKRMNDLIRYPYGCIEQTISSVFPQLYLPHLSDLKDYQKQAVTDNVNDAIKRLTRYQISAGFAFWPVSDHGTPQYSEWGTSYAGHFLIVAKGFGYHIPQALYNHWINDAQQKAKTVNTKNHRYQTYRLFLLALAGVPNMGAMNLVHENHLSGLDPLSGKLLAAAYYITGQKAVAREIGSRISGEIPSYREMGDTYGSALRDQALMTYLCLLMEDERTASSLLQRISRQLRPQGWYSTQETAMAILAFVTYYKTVPFTGGTIPFEITLPGKTQKIELRGYQTALPLENTWGKEIRITTDHGDPLFVSLITEGIPVEDRIRTEHKGLELERRYINEDGQFINVDIQPQGKPFWIVYTVNSTYSERIEEVALSCIFPSGWEIVNPRLSGSVPPGWLLNLSPTEGAYMDIRDDRVNWFFDVFPNRKMTFAIKINPTFKGTYILPPVVCEAMYSPEFYARIASGEVTVK